MDATAPPNTSPLPRRRRSRLRIALVVGALATSALLIASYVVLRLIAEETLRTAIGEADRLDPGWRLSEIEARRRIIPEGQNSSRVVQDVLKRIPEDWWDSKVAEARREAGGPPRGFQLYDFVSKITPEVRLSESEQDGLQAEMQELFPAVDEARKLADMGEGRLAPSDTQVFPVTPDVYAANTRRVVYLLRMDAVLRAHEEDLDGALDSCRAILGTARSLGDEPDMISQMVRMMMDTIAVDTLVRVLAQGEATDAALARLQEQLATEADQPLALSCLRYERARSFDMFDRLIRGEILPSAFYSGRSEGPNPLTTVWPIAGVFYRYNQALILSFLNRAVEIVKRPAEEQPSLWVDWARTTKLPASDPQKFAGSLTYKLLPGHELAALIRLRATVSLETGAFLIALERHRRAHGRWPDSPEQLVPRFLAKTPVDPYDTGPLRVARRDNGLVVYSVGQDGIDDGGRLDSEFGRDAVATDWGYRLWDVDRRRQPPPEPHAAVDGPEPESSP